MRLIPIRPGACVLSSPSWPWRPTRRKPVTVEQIYRQEQATRPPDGIAWSPDGTRVSYIDDNGDLLAVEGGTGSLASTGRPRQDEGP